jgi:hypothetical protein
MIDVARRRLDGHPGDRPSEFDAVTGTTRTRAAAMQKPPEPLEIHNQRQWQPGLDGASVANMGANFTDPGSADTHTCSYSWDDGTADTARGS